MKSSRLVSLGVALLLAGCRPSTSVSGRVEILGADSAAGVLVESAGGDGAAVVTGADGAFTLEVPPGPVTLVATAGAVTPRRLVIEDVDSTQPVVLRFTAVGTLAGVATRGGRPTGNAGVVARVPDVEGAATVTADDGAFLLEVPVGLHRVEAVAPGHAPARSAEVEVRRGETARVDPLVLRLLGWGNSGALRGQVRRIGAADSGGVEVLVEGAGITTTTDADGVFELADVPEGSYTLRFSRDGYTERVPDVLVVAGADGFLVDGGLYRLGDYPISLMAANHLDPAPAKLGRGRGPRVTWLSGEEASLSVRWMDVRDEVVHEAGAIGDPGRREVTLPEVEADGSAVLWASMEGIFSSPTDGGPRRQIASGRVVAWPQLGVGAGGLVAFEDYLANNELVLRLVPIEGGEPRVVQRRSQSQGGIVEASFLGGALSWIDEVGENRLGTLRWWRNGEMKTLGRADAYSLGGPATRYRSSYDGAQVTLFDLEAGEVALRHPGYFGRFSTDGTWYAYSSATATMFFDLATRQSTTVHDGWLDIYCADGDTAFGAESGAWVSVSRAGQVSTWPDLAVGAYYIAACGDGWVYWSQIVASRPAGKLRLWGLPLSGGAPVLLADGLSGFGGLRLDVARRTLWLFGRVDEAPQPQLWVLPSRGGPMVKVLEGVDLSPSKVTASPGGGRLALASPQGLYVASADGLQVKQVSDAVAEVAWVDEETLVFTRPAPLVPRRFQGGLYVARLP